jgi:hypothetical protein
MISRHLGSPKVVALAAGFVVSVGVFAPGCSGNDPSPTSRGPGDGSTALSADGGANSKHSSSDSGLTGFVVGKDAPICSADLPFKAPGCACTQGTADLACWTGPANQRHVGQCHDGVQHGVGTAEFAQWTACEGEEHLCNWPGEHVDGGSKVPDAGHEAPPPPPPPTQCGCTPGATIGCDEDCQTLVICSLTGYKTCQPDRTWGPCHETLNVTGVVNNVLGCRNWLNGCVPGTEGFYSGDCSAAYACGKAPGQL